MSTTVQVFESQVKVGAREVVIQAVCYYNEQKGQGFLKLSSDSGDATLEVYSGMARIAGPGYDLIVSDTFSITRVREWIRQVCEEIEKEKQRQAQTLMSSKW